MQGTLRIEVVASAAGVTWEDLCAIIATLRASGLTQARIEHFSTSDILWNTPPKNSESRPISGKVEIEWRRRMDALKPAVQAIHHQLILMGGGPIDFEGPPA
jgi:hypothetical protein